MAIAVSFALQHGADAEAIRRALCRSSDGQPLGPLGVLLDLIAGDFGMIDVPAMRNCARHCSSATHNNTWTTSLGGALRQHARRCSRLFVDAILIIT